MKEGNKFLQSGPNLTLLQYIKKGMKSYVIIIEKEKGNDQISEEQNSFIGLGR